MSIETVVLITYRERVDSPATTAYGLAIEPYKADRVTSETWESQNDDNTVWRLTRRYTNLNAKVEFLTLCRTHANLSTPRSLSFISETEIDD